MNWTKTENVIWEKLNGGALLVNPDTGARWSLNATAGAVWKLCDGRTNLSDIAASIARPCNEVSAFCREFVTLGLLRKQAAPVAIASNGATFRLAMPGAPGFKAHGLGNGQRRRPNPRGVSGPA